MNNTMILGVGGAGCNMAGAIKRKATADWLRNASYVFADRNRHHLSEFEDLAYKTIDLFTGAEGISADIFSDVDSLFVVAGLGGGTSYGYLPEIIRRAHSVPVKNIYLVVTTPFSFEGDIRMIKANETLADIGNLDNIKIIVLANESLLERFPEFTFFNAFEISDNEVLKAIESEATA